MEIAGTGFSIVGAEVILLAAGIGTPIGGVGCTPAPIQRWLLQSYFGKDPSWTNFSHKREKAYPKGDWQAEFEGLKQALAGDEDAGKGDHSKTGELSEITSSHEAAAK